LEKLDIDISQVKKLVELVEMHDLEELTVESDDLSITVKGRVKPTANPVIVHTGAQVTQPEQIHEVSEEPAEVEVEPNEPEIAGNIVDIIAPLVGVFYRAPAPEAPNFVEVGDSIEVGSEVGLIEAMKVFSPIPSEIAGVVVDIPGQNGKLVQEGEVLVRIKISEE